MYFKIILSIFVFIFITLNIVNGQIGIGILDMCSSCNSNDKCYKDSCNLINGCKHDPVDCSRDDMCMIYSCHPTIGWVEKPKNCNDNNPNTVDLCDSNFGCINIPFICTNDVEPCQNGTTSCVKQFVNESGFCCQHESIDCDDYNPCTDDFCTAENGCQHSPVTCEDNDPCTIETCSSLDGGCKYEKKKCDDDDLCTIDSCNSSNIDGNECVHTPISCDDNNPDTVDECHRHIGCVHHAANTCDDLNKCTTDTNTTSGCRYALKTCGISTFCTQWKCDPVRGCVPTTQDCDDGNPCTYDICDSSSQACVHITKNCYDGDRCTHDKCDTATGKCIGTPIPFCYK